MYTAQYLHFCECNSECFKHNRLRVWPAASSKTCQQQQLLPSPKRPSNPPRAARAEPTAPTSATHRGGGNPPCTHEIPPTANDAQGRERRDPNAEPTPRAASPSNSNKQPLTNSPDSILIRFRFALLLMLQGVVMRRICCQMCCLRGICCRCSFVGCCWCRCGMRCSWWYSVLLVLTTLVVSSGRASGQPTRVYWYRYASREGVKQISALVRGRSPTGKLLTRWDWLLLSVVFLLGVDASTCWILFVRRRC